jgi:DNA-binding NtrC family response regulator
MIPIYLISHIICYVKFSNDRKSKELKLTERPALSTGALDRLTAYDWPGNVRELEKRS